MIEISVVNGHVYLIIAAIIYVMYRLVKHIIEDD